MSSCRPSSHNLPLPIIGSPLFIISNPKLVIEQCKAGIVGSMPALERAPGRRSWTNGWPRSPRRWRRYDTRASRADRRAPFAINQIVHKSNDRLEHDMADVREVQGADRHHLARRAHRRQRRGARLGRRRAARHHQQHASRSKAIEKGADGLIAVAAGAGGHAGRQEPVRAGPGDPRVVRRPGRAVGRDRHRRRRAGRAGDGRRLRLHRLGLHRHRTRRARATTTSRRSSTAARDDIVYSNLLHRRARQLPEAPASAPPGWTRTTCPRATSSTMNFGGGEGARRRPGRTSGAAGQGIGAVTEVTSAAALPADGRLEARVPGRPRAASPSDAAVALTAAAGVARAAAGRGQKGTCTAPDRGAPPGALQARCRRALRPLAPAAVG